MKDAINSCRHTLTDNIEYKEVVVIGNGPSGMVTSFMLAGNVPYLKEIPQDLPIDEMLRARLSNLPPGQSLYETDLMELAEGLEGRSQNPIPLLMDNLMRPCADLGIQAESLIEWKYDVEKQIDHIVLGRGPPGGAWPTFPPAVRTLSPAAWLTLPPHAAPGGTASQRLSARAVATYCRRYVHACKLQKYFRSGVVVNSVTRIPRSEEVRCQNTRCPLNANFCVTGYDKSRGVFRYAARRVVVACGAGDRPARLPGLGGNHALHSLLQLQRALQLLPTVAQPRHAPPGSPPGCPRAVVVGSGVSAADAVWLCLQAGLHVSHLHRTPAEALARLSPQTYPDYCQVYKMMCDGPSGNYPNYTPYPNHMIVEVTDATDSDKSCDINSDDIEENALTPKKITILNILTNETTEITASVLVVFIGSKPDLFFLQTNFNLNCIENDHCVDETKHPSKRKIEEKQCFLKNHWLYLKSMLGQSIQSCKSRYLSYTEINGNTDTKCFVPDCKRVRIDDRTCKCELIQYSDRDEASKCTCQNENPYSNGVGFGIDPKKPVDGRSNPIAIDKGTHELLNGPKGIYALGPVTGDNFVRFIPGGALAIVAHMHKENKLTTD